MQLKRQLKQFETAGDDFSAMRLTDKYEVLLTTPDSESELSLAEVDSVFSALLGETYVRGKK